VGSFCEIVYRHFPAFEKLLQQEVLRAGNAELLLRAARGARKRGDKHAERIQYFTDCPSIAVHCMDVHVLARS
jgi:hypothetical protein